MPSVEQRLTELEDTLRLLRGTRLANADKFQGRRISSATPSSADVMKWDATDKVWKPEAPSTAIAHTLDSTTHPDVASMTEAQGDIFYRDASFQVQKLGAGTAGQHLRTGGVGANPSWETTNPITETYVSFGSEPVTGQTITV